MVGMFVTVFQAVYGKTYGNRPLRHQRALPRILQRTLKPALHMHPAFHHLCLMCNKFLDNTYFNITRLTSTCLGNHMTKKYLVRYYKLEPKVGM